MTTVTVTWHTSFHTVSMHLKTKPEKKIFFQNTLLTDVDVWD